MPNIGLVETCGQSLSSVPSMADHCFISSEIGGRVCAPLVGFLAIGSFDFGQQSSLAASAVALHVV
jgi:hypothetical protein